jgi:hypothetical protein
VTGNTVMKQNISVNGSTQLDGSLNVVGSTRLNGAYSIIQQNKNIEAIALTRSFFLNRGTECRRSCHLC